MGPRGELGVNRPPTPIVSEWTMRRCGPDSASRLSGFRSGRREVKDLLADVAIVVQVGPTAAEPHHDASRGLDQARRYFDQPHAPRARMALAQRIAIASLVEEASAGIARQRLARG